MTGAGKTYTMFGEKGSNQSQNLVQIFFISMLGSYLLISSESIRTNIPNK